MTCMEFTTRRYRGEATHSTRRDPVWQLGGRKLTASSLIDDNAKDVVLGLRN